MTRQSGAVDVTSPDGLPDEPPTVREPDDEARRLRRHLDDLGLSGMVDVHTHFMPDSVMKKVWGYFDSAGPLTGRHWPIAYRAPQPERLETLRSFGVEWFPSLCYPHKPDMAEWLNGWCAEFAAETPGCLHSATFFPEPEAGRYVVEAIEAGAQVFKAHVQVGAYDPNDPLLDPVWGALAESATPVVLHSGNGPVPGKHTGPPGVRALLERYPDLVLVIAHMGLPDYADFLDVAATANRVHLDTTMVFTAFTEASSPFPRELRPRLADLGDRILFGSDFPNIPYSYLEAVEAILDLDLGSDWNRRVLALNALDLFRLPPG